MDNRFSEDFVQDRNGNKLKAVNINTIEEIENYDADVYIIDEFQLAMDKSHFCSEIHVVVKIDHN